MDHTGLNSLDPVKSWEECCECSDCLGQLIGTYIIGFPTPINLEGIRKTLLFLRLAVTVKPPCCFTYRGI